ncbi:MAG: ankyrin repeat domain-containing protein [Parachlamydiaceae bacterium]
MMSSSISSILQSPAGTLPDGPSRKRPREHKKEAVTKVAHQRLKKQRAEHPTQESFLPLNEECTLRILTLLDAQDLCRIAQVSKRASELAKQVIEAFYSLDDNCLFHFLTLLDFRDLWEVAQVNRQMNALAMKAMHVIGKKMLGQRFLLQHSDSLSTVQRELLMLKRELEHLVKETQDEMDFKQTVKSAQEEGLEQIKALIKDRLDARNIRGSIDNLGNLSVEGILNIFASETFNKRYPRVINAIAIHYLNSTVPKLNDGESHVELQKMYVLAVQLAIRSGQTNVLRFLTSIGDADRIRKGSNKENILHHLVRLADLSLFNVVVEELKKQKKLQSLIEAEDNMGNTPLLLSIHHGQAFECLIKAGANPLHRNQAGQTLIHLAARHSRVSYLSLVLEKLTALGFKEEDLLEAEDKMGITPLFYAMQYQARKRIQVPDVMEKVELFLTMKANALNQEGESILHLAAKDEHVSEDLLLVIIKERPDLINTKDSDGRTPIFDAIDHPAKFQILVRQGADIHVKDDNGRTLLHFAVGKHKVLQNLLSYCLDIDSTDCSGFSPLSLALRHHQDFELLISNRANINCRNAYGQSLLHQAAMDQKVSLETLKKVLELGLDLEEQDDYGNTPIFNTMREPEKFNVFLERSANVHHQNQAGQTPLHQAADIGIPEVLKKLLETGVILEAEDNSGQTPLFLAIKRFKKGFSNEDRKLQSLEKLRLLLERNANIHHQNHKGQTPLHYAANFGTIEVLDKLLEAGAILEAEDHDGQTPLFYAVKRFKHDFYKEDEKLQSFKRLEFLLDNDANIHRRTKGGTTIFDLAEEINDPQLNELLATYRP